MGWAPTHLVFLTALVSQHLYPLAMVWAMPRHQLSAQALDARTHSSRTGRHHGERSDALLNAADDRILTPAEEHPAARANPGCEQEGACVSEQRPDSATGGRNHDALAVHALAGVVVHHRRALQTGRRLSRQAVNTSVLCAWWSHKCAHARLLLQVLALLVCQEVVIQPRAGPPAQLLDKRLVGGPVNSVGRGESPPVACLAATTAGATHSSVSVPFSGSSAVTHSAATTSSARRRTLQGQDPVGCRHRARRRSRA